MVRLVADVIGHIPLSWKPPCPDRQVGEVAPAPRLDVIDSMTSGERKSKKDRSLSKLSMLTTESEWPTEKGPNHEIWASRDSVCHRGSDGARIKFGPRTEAAHWGKYVIRIPGGEVGVSREGFPPTVIATGSATVHMGSRILSCVWCPNRGRDESRRRKNAEENCHGDVSDLRRRLRSCRCLGARH